jgi:RNA recognition motif-containing protein
MASDFGEITSVDLPLTRDGNRNKGYAFIKFEKRENADLFVKYWEQNYF